MLIVPQGWREFQHYKDRNPPWIRLHRKLLDNKEFHRLPVASRALAPMLWLLASESVDGVIDADPDNLAFRLRCSEKEVSSAVLPLLERGFFLKVQSDSNVLAERKRDAVPETEAEAETETEAEAEAEPFRQPAAAGKAKRDPAKSAAAWVAYSDAYRRRYTVEPVRNAQVNAQMAQFVAKVAAEEAPEIAAFYLRHNDRFYLSKGHSVGAMLRDAEKLRMEWASGRVVNPTLPNEPAWRAEQRQRTQQAAPGVAVGNAADFFDMETRDVTPIALGR